MWSHAAAGRGSIPSPIRTDCKGEFAMSRRWCGCVGGCWCVQQHSLCSRCFTSHHLHQTAVIVLPTCPVISFNCACEVHAHWQLEWRWWCCCGLLPQQRLHMHVQLRCQHSVKLGTAGCKRALPSRGGVATECVGLLHCSKHTTYHGCMCVLVMQGAGPYSMHIYLQPA